MLYLLITILASNYEEQQATKWQPADCPEVKCKVLFPQSVLCDWLTAGQKFLSSTTASNYICWRPGTSRVNTVQVCLAPS